MFLASISEIPKSLAPFLKSGKYLSINSLPKDLEVAFLIADTSFQDILPISLTIIITCS